MWGDVSQLIFSSSLCLSSPSAFFPDSEPPLYTFPLLFFYSISLIQCWALWSGVMELTSAGSTCCPSPCECSKLLGNIALPSSTGIQVGSSGQPEHLTRGIKWHLQVGNIKHVGIHSSAINNKKFLQKLSISSLSLFFISAANNLQQ